LSDLMTIKKKNEAPKHLKPLGYQSGMVTISAEDYQKLDSSRKVGIQSYLASKLDHNLALKRNE